MSTEFTDSTEGTESTEGSGMDTDFTASESSDAGKPKSSNKVIIVVALVAVVAVVGFYGMRIMNGSPSTPAPAPAPVAELPSDAPGVGVSDPTVSQEDPLAALANSSSTDQVEPVSEEFPADPLGVDPLGAPVQPVASDFDSLYGPGQVQPVDPSQVVQPVDPSQVVQPVDPSQVVQAVDPSQIVQAAPEDSGFAQPIAPAVQAPVAPGVSAAPQMDPALAALMGQDPSAAPAPVVPAPVQPVTPAVAEPVAVEPVAPAEPSSTPVSFDGDGLAAVVGKAVTDALRPMEERWNSRFDSLERRVSRVESAPRPSTPRPAATRAPTPKPSAPPRARTSTAPSTPTNRIEVLDAPVTAPSARPVVSVPPRSSTAPSASCSLGAVLEGRAWLKRDDGSFESYIVGDSLPDGKVITAITPERGIVVGDKSWSCN